MYGKWLIAAALAAAVLSGGKAAAAGPLVVDGAALETGTYVYQETTYVPLRTVTEALRPDAEVVWEDGQAVARAEGLDLSAQPGAAYIEANGRALYVPAGVHVIQGTTLVPVRVLAEALDAQVDWDSSTGTVTVTSGSGAITPAGLHYDETDLYWLSRIISAESRGEPFLGQIAVGNVILNRVASPDFPDSIYEVIFDRRWGGQFTPASSGTIYDTPSESSILAAKLCLEGADAAGESLYFLAPALAGNLWTMEERTHVTTIGSHWFYR